LKPNEAKELMDLLDKYSDIEIRVSIADRVDLINEIQPLGYFTIITQTAWSPHEVVVSDKIPTDT
jgi:hypothetical protein